MKITTIILPILLLGLFSCATDGNSSSTTEKSSTSSHSSCLVKYSNSYDKLLTKEDVLKEYTVDFTKVEVKYDTSNTSPRSEVLLYTWPSNRKSTKEILGKTYTFPADNKIGIGHFKVYSEGVKDPLQTFKRMYHFTEKEKSKAVKKVDKEIENQEASKSQKELAKKLGNTIAADMDFSPIQGVGDAAVWDYLDGGLIVLTGNLRFTVLVDISKDHQKDVELAKKMAQLILAKCN